MLSFLWGDDVKSNLYISLNKLLTPVVCPIRISVQSVNVLLKLSIQQEEFVELRFFVNI